MSDKALMDGGAMGLWHAVQYYDVHKLKDELSYEAWPSVSFSFATFNEFVQF